MRFEMSDYKSLKTAIEDIRMFLLDCAISQECIFNSKLIATELLGNILQHSKGKASIHVDVGEEFVVLQIESAERFIPQASAMRKCPETTAERGRGLYLVDCLSADWTVGEDGIFRVRIKK